MLYQWLRYIKIRPNPTPTKIYCYTWESLDLDGITISTVFSTQCQYNEDGVHFLSASQISPQEYSLVMSYYLCIPKVSKVRLSVFVIHRELSNLSGRWLSCIERILCGYKFTVFEKYWSVCKICRVVTICCQQIISLEQKKTFLSEINLYSFTDHVQETSFSLEFTYILHIIQETCSWAFQLFSTNLYPVEISGSSGLIHCVVYPHTSPFFKTINLFWHPQICTYMYTCLLHVSKLIPSSKGRSVIPTETVKETAATYSCSCTDW